MTRDTLVSRHAALIGDIDEDTSPGWSVIARGARRPAFWPGEETPSHAAIRRWADQWR